MLLRIAPQRCGHVQEKGIAAIGQVFKFVSYCLPLVFVCEAMPSAPEERRRKEYREILESGKEMPYEPKTETNRCILAEVRAEVQKAKRQIHQEAEQGNAQIKSVTDAGVTLIKDVTKQEKIEGKKQIRANAAKGKKSVQQAGGVAVQLIKDIAETEKLKITNHAEAAAQEALRKAIPAAEAHNADSSASSAAFTTSPTMSSVTEPVASRPSSKRPIQPPDTRPSTVALVQKTEALSTPAHKDKRVDNEDAARATKKPKTTEVIAELAQVHSPAAPEERNAASAEEPLDSGGPDVEPSVTQDIPDAVPPPAVGSGRTEVAEMIEQRSPVASAEDANASVIAKNSIEEELALVPMEAEAQAAQATMPAPVLPLVRQSRAPPEEGTAFQAPMEPEHAKLRKEAI